MGNNFQIQTTANREIKWNQHTHTHTRRSEPFKQSLAVESSLRFAGALFFFLYIAKSWKKYHKFMKCKTNELHKKHARQPLLSTHNFCFYSYFVVSLELFQKCRIIYNTSIALGFTSSHSCHLQVCTSKCAFDMCSHAKWNLQSLTMYVCVSVFN